MPFIFHTFFEAIKVLLTHNCNSDTKNIPSFDTIKNITKSFSGKNQNV